MRWSRSGSAGAAIVVVAALAQFAPASAADPTGLVNIAQIAAPATVVAPAGPSSATQMFVFAEQANVVLGRDVRIDMTAKAPYARGGAVRRGTTVTSYYLVCTPPPEGPERVQIQGRLTFDQPIIAVIHRTAYLASSDADVGAPGTAYGGAYRWRGIEWDNPDLVGIGTDGKTLYVTCDAPVTDQLRVLVGTLPSAYVAMGDSFSSGEGVFAYDPNTTRPGIDECHRGNAGRAWPELVAAAITQNDFRFAACSGAKISNILENAQLGSEQWNNGPQIDAITKWPPGATRSFRDYFVNLVTFSIGINNARLSKVITACVASDSGVVNSQLPGKCEETGNAAVAQGITEIRSRYPGLLGRVHRAAPVAKIRVVGYPNIFPATPTVPCVLGTLDVGGFVGTATFYWSPTNAPPSAAQQLATINLLKGWQNQLNTAISGVVSTWATNWNANPRHVFDQVDARFVSTETALAPNLMCNGNAANTWSWNALLFNTTTRKPLAESFHPNVAGHAAIAPLVVNSLS